MHSSAADAQLTLASLSTFDWFLVGLVVLSAALAFRRGMIRVLFSLAGVAAGMLLAGWYYVWAAQWLHPWISSPVAAQVLAFFFILALVTIVVSLAAAFVRRAVKAAGLGIFDRLLGALFGAARGWLLGVAVVLVIAAFVPRSPWLKNSHLAPYFLTGGACGILRHAAAAEAAGSLRLSVAAAANLCIFQTSSRLASPLATQSNWLESGSQQAAM